MLVTEDLLVAEMATELTSQGTGGEFSLRAAVRNEDLSQGWCLSYEMVRAAADWTRDGSRRSQSVVLFSKAVPGNGNADQEDAGALAPDVLSSAA